jgi:rSAM/selenodomain-associated transferase 1
MNAALRAEALRLDPKRRCFKPTLIVFAREPVAGRAKTRLIPVLGARAAAALAHAFNLDAAAKAARIGAPLLVAGSGRAAYFANLAGGANARFIRQGWGSLGERMARALARRRRCGALLIGTDTPSLPRSHIERAIELLKSAPVVLGPSLDGGYYLVGIRGPTPDIFRDIPWGSSQVLTQTIDRLAAQATAYALAPWWYDVDEADDLWLLAAHLRLIQRKKARRASRREASALNNREHPCPATAELLLRMRLI